MKFIESHNDPFTSNDIIHAVRKRFWIILQKHQLIQFLKEHLNLSFKKGTSRPSNINHKRLDSLKWLFSVRLTKRITDHSLIVNIDESTFSRNTKRHYSWIRKDENCSISNIKFFNSMSVTAWIWSNGFSYCCLIDGTVTSKIFLEYFHRLIYHIVHDMQICFSNCLFIMDNCSIHRSKPVHNFWLKQKLNIHFLVPYCPELAPV